MRAAPMTRPARARLAVAATLSALAVTLNPLAAAAAESEAGGLDGRTLSPLWAVPFAGILLSIALGPVLAPRLWHHHYGKVALAWGAATALALLAHAGPGPAFDTLLHTLLLEYLPFVLLLLAFFLVDSWYLRGESRPEGVMLARLRLEGRANLPLLVAILCAVMASGMWSGGTAISFRGLSLTWAELLRDVALLAVVLVS